MARVGRGRGDAATTAWTGAWRAAVRHVHRWLHRPRRPEPL